MLYLFYGPDEFARSEAVRSLRDKIPADLLNLNSATLDGRKLNLHELAVACEALPFLTDKRLVIVNDVCKQSKAGKERDDLRDYLDRVPASCDLVFVEHEDFDKRSTLFTYLKKHGHVTEFLPLQGGELLKWLNERANTMHVRLERKVAQHLIEYVGNDSRLLITELEKLATYVGRGGEIREETIDLLIQDRQEYNLFTFIDLLSQRKRGEALKGVHALLDEGQATTYIMFMLARQVRILLSVYDMYTQSKRAEEIAAKLRQKPFVIKKALEQIRGFRLEELKTIHDRLLEFDRATKTGRINSEAALDILVMEVCSE